MIRLHEPRQNDASNTSSRRWPFPELQRLLKAESAQGGDAGARQVLVAGIDCDELTTWLKTLGLEVALFNETVHELSTASQDGSRFELVFATELNSPQSNLLDISSRARTARLLSQLRPSGRLLVLSPQAAEPSRPFIDGHHAACWIRHLACFPGKLQAMRVHSPVLTRSVWHWMFGAGTQPGDADQLPLSIVSMRIPAEPVTAAAWQDHVRRGLLTGSVCCELAMPAASGQRRAA